ncbi:hypothetical protein KHQ84_gp109 [Rhodococcus phage Finch]|uniref:Uncharacterized protein n=1 Tax=Rhodococcus phage Finch TaxID=2094144 RepID=A0A2P1JXG2_9CAUD|nr:hypothetical protein KHQ84_gp109 [Rhodococcus phage Finch]AVO25041.1 hypothetical protein SEA_FINCH_109 [Rhodococcus phage Finch]
MGEIILSFEWIDRDFDFTEMPESRHGPGWYEGSCLNCDAETNGTAPVLREWAYAHHPECPGRNAPQTSAEYTSNAGHDYIANGFAHYRRMVATHDSYRFQVIKHALEAGWTDDQIMKGLHGE